MTTKASSIVYQLDLNFKNKVITWLIICTLIFMAPCLYTDGNTVSCQWLTNIIIIPAIFVFFLLSNKRFKHRMLIIMFAASLAEFIGTSVLQLYTYRLNNVPAYVPFAHAGLFFWAYHLQKKPIVCRHSKLLIKILYRFAVVICSFFFIVLNDTGGFFCFLVFITLLSQRRNKLFYLLMFYITLYGEILGTSMNVWAWKTTITTLSYSISAYNPPIGVMGVYMVLDLVTNNIYFWGFLMNKKRSSNGTHVGLAQIFEKSKEILYLSLSLIDLIFGVLFAKFGYKSLAKEREKQKTIHVTDLTFEDTLKNFSTLKSSFLNSLKEFECQLEKQQALFSSIEEQKKIEMQPQMINEGCVAKTEMSS